jgi:hypothetical protein
MNNVFAAIYRRFRRMTGPKDPYTLTGGKMFRTQTPPGTALDPPYIVVTFVSEAPLRTFNHDNIEQSTLQMMVYGEFKNDSSPVAEVWDAVKRLYDLCDLGTMDDSTHVVMRRINTHSETVSGHVVQVGGDWRIERQRAAS